MAATALTSAFLASATATFGFSSFLTTGAFATALVSGFLLNKLAKPHPFVSFFSFASTFGVAAATLGLSAALAATALTSAFLASATATFGFSSFLTTGALAATAALVSGFLLNKLAKLHPLVTFLSLVSAFLAMTVFGAVVVVFAFGAAAVLTSSFLTTGALAAMAALVSGFLLNKLAKLQPFVSFFSFGSTFSFLVAARVCTLFAFDLFCVPVLIAVFDKFSSFLEKMVSKVTF